MRCKSLGQGFEWLDGWVVAEALTSTGTLASSGTCTYPSDTQIRSPPPESLSIMHFIKFYTIQMGIVRAGEWVRVFNEHCCAKDLQWRRSLEVT